MKWFALCVPIAISGIDFAFFLFGSQSPGLHLFALFAAGVCIGIGIGGFAAHLGSEHAKEE